MKHVTLFKGILTIFCLGLFSYQVWVSYKKLRSSDVISLSRTVTEDYYEVPDVRFCHETALGRNMSSPTNMSDVYKAKGLLTETILGVQVGSLIGGHSLDPKEEEWTEDAIVFILPEKESYFFVECYTLNREKFELRHGTTNGIQIYLNVSASSKYGFQILYISGPGNSIYSEKSLFGTDIALLDLKSLDIFDNDTVNAISYNIQSTLREKLPIEKEYECTPEGTDTIYSCIMKDMIRSAQCRSPYDKGFEEWRVCSTEADFDRIQSYHKDPEEKLKVSYYMNKLGCELPCAHREYKIAPLAVAKHRCSIPQGCRNTITLHIISMSDQVEVITEKWLYDEANFIADVGGYLGLLLGVSILTLFDYSYSFVILVKNYMVSYSKASKTHY